MKNVHRLDRSNFSQIYMDYFDAEGRFVRHIARGGRILDVGCGICSIVPYIYDSCASYTGIDIDAKAIREVEESVKPKYPGIETVLTDAKILRYFKEGSFDTTLCLWNTLTTIGNEHELIRNIYRITKGRTVVTVSLRDDRCFRERLEYYQKAKINHTANPQTQAITSKMWGTTKAFTEEELEALLRKSGVGPKDIGKIGYMAVYAIF